MLTEELFGWIASILTTLIFIPQIYKAFKTRLTNDISMLMMVLAILGNIAWLIHASLTDNMPLIVCASLIIIMSFVLITFKVKNERT
ncbi:MAG: SemiSWEET family transporter [Gammaproteobacteria bacterium]|nr:SemiSWEET family transporter [Gammaproteobacteria bacterium]